MQSNYIPWKGYFDLIRAVDEFVLYDDAQYTGRDWRNRNRIKTARGLQWLTVPVETTGRGLQAVKDVRISDTAWGRRHWQAISRAYARAPHFRRYREVFEPLYLRGKARFLSEVNRQFIEAVNRLLGTSTVVRFSMDYAFDRRSDRTTKLLDLCRRAGGTEYLSGPTARAYFDVPAFRKNGIEVRFADYSGYAEYPQFFGPFVHEVTVLDLLFHAGPQAARFMKRLDVHGALATA